MSQTNRSIDRAGEPRIRSKDPLTADNLQSHFHLPPNLFFTEFLNDALHHADGLAGQVWGLDPTGRLTKICSTNTERLQQFEHPDVVEQHRDAISKTLFSGKVVTSPFRESVNQSESDRLLWLGPIHLGTESIGVVELILPKRLEQTQGERLKQLLSRASDYLLQRSLQGTNDEVAESKLADSLRGTKQAADTLPHREPTPSADDPSKLGSQLEPQEIECLVLLLHNQTELNYVAATAVNEVRRLLRADRVSLAVQRGGKTSIIAVSGQQRIQPRSNVVHIHQTLSDRIVRSARDIQSDRLDQSTESAFANVAEEFLSETGAAWFAGLPLFEPEKIDFDSDTHVSERTAFAAIIVEQFAGVNDSEASTSAIQADLQRLTPHLAQAVFHALQQEQILLLPLRRRMGRISEKLKLTRTKLWLGLAVVIAVVGAMTVVKVPYRVQATGRLMPVQQFRAFAPFNAEVQEVWVASGQAVQADQALLRLHDESLETRRIILANNLAEKRKLLVSYKAQLDENSSAISQSDRIGISAKLTQTQMELDGLQQQIESTEKLNRRSVLQTKIAGTVATFRPEDLLSGRPVGRGELLLEVMNEQGPWQLELRLPANRLGHLVESLSRPPEAESDSNRSLTFVQATAPGATFTATINELSTRSVTPSDGAAVVLLNAGISDDQGFRRTIGAEVTARIPCGKKSLGYVWFGDLWDWFQRNVW